MIVTDTNDVFTPNPDKLTFIPLGGCGRFEGNLNAYCYGGKILLIDLGIGFADDYHPGVDILLPDPQWLEDKKDQIVGLIITHTHEDHLGSVGHLWDRLRCPIYATPYAAEIAKRKLIEHHVVREAEIIQINLEAELDLKPFDIKLINAAHSTPESSMVLIKTSSATVLHTGDWRLDDTPIMTEKTNEDFLKSLGDKESVDVLIGDSTNSVKEGNCASFSDLYHSFEQVLERAPYTVVFACQGYSSLSRIKILGEIAQKYDRKLAILGWSINRAYDTAVDLGMMNRCDIMVSDKEMVKLPREQQIFVCTGSQAENRAALTRIAYGAHHIVKLVSGDTVAFSARIIPGKERGIANMKQALSRSGINIITNNEIDNVYVSGHAQADEVRRLYDWIKPRAVLPVHGDYGHQVAQANIARSKDIYVPFIPENGNAVEISDGVIETVGQVPTGYLAVDGKRIIPAHNSQSMSQRRKIGENGSVAVTILLDKAINLTQDPMITILGLAEDEQDEDALITSLIKEIKNYLSKMKSEKKQELNDDNIKETVRLAVMRRIRDTFGKKPLFAIHVIRV